ncbi:helix-turn-helix domain-containing protein [Paraburkholderia sp. 1N]|uniref:Helix-turn-helix domain-containing protein n=1 Tax=Paraburkholderia solitsugae TaxID=2675748 RepID=A0ABX2BHT1_9BURK|nr:AraC family transcriptional regulator [Paraburkholderia solitsugae]NPT40517.1 helix-turn-helix domain-containing protein [Paraburkholderia solitsugae]
MNDNLNAKIAAHDAVAPSSPVLYQGTIDSLHATAVRYRYEDKNFGYMPVPEREDSYFLGVKLRSMSSVRMWYGERLASAAPMPVNAICFTHFDNQPHAELYDPFDCMVFRIPAAALGRIVEDAGARRIEELRCPDPGVLDPILGHLASCLLPALDDPSSASTLFVDTLTRALNIHVLSLYGDLAVPVAKPRQAGLAAWQQGRAKDLIRANLAGNLTVGDLAAECGLSVGHFAYAFKQSVGLSPYQYLIEQRLARAKQLMLETRLSLSDIASMSGFANQAHFNGRFVKAFGVPPGAWRRMLDSSTSAPFLGHEG